MIGIIGGSGVYQLTEMADNIENTYVKTNYGEDVKVSLLDVKQKKVAFISRHSEGHSYPPHMINYRANIDALKSIGVNQIIATNSVGSLNENIGPGSIAVATDFLDFTKNRPNTFFDNDVVHVDVTEPYCYRLNDIILSQGDNIKNGVYVGTEGPRFESPAEIKMFNTLGGDFVGMTGLPETVLAREREICYSAICLVSNFAAGISEDKLTIDEVFEIVDVKKDELVNLIYKTIQKLPDEYDCDCLNALNGAGV
ncbi:S-methyl-5'-thioadenosine phosphorylase [Methanobrevibacter sp. OttesenSCG-928-K11]|nr:S-methyl-5'-thioadenosine phosphorylase [Methanobrevibacter sp. OttesenSCG-928-K11]MDL2270245.1 S-methyl-5'-thioadenosine phosphorylase [Methanobrevibacter sp. OttesenSCG-928-I08]